MKEKRRKVAKGKRCLLLCICIHYNNDEDLFSGNRSNVFVRLISINIIKCFHYIEERADGRNRERGWHRSAPKLFHKFPLTAMPRDKWDVVFDLRFTLCKFRSNTKASFNFSLSPMWQNFRKQSLYFPLFILLLLLLLLLFRLIYFYPQQLFVGANRCDFPKEFIRQRKLTFVSSFAFEMIQRQKQKQNNKYTMYDVNNSDGKAKNSCVNNMRAFVCITCETHQKSEHSWCELVLLERRQDEG